VQYKTVVPFLFCFGKGEKGYTRCDEKASGVLTNSETRPGHLFSISYTEGKRIGGKTVGKLYKYAGGHNTVSTTK
jgi:hypothetical protein